MDRTDSSEYRSPEIARVADAEQVTLGNATPVADLPGNPDAGYRDASKDTPAKYPGEQLDV